MSEDPVQRALSVALQKNIEDLKKADKDNARLRAALLDAADHLRRAGYHRASELAKDAAT